ncbi:MAG: Rne/Rng family ribonuclease, partial [Acidobacteriota bacterium]|nr:Rne/Rng family ribonuclease [Acidobacteriota bacterium]
ASSAILPGESISKYRDGAPAEVPAAASEEEAPSERPAREGRGGRGRFERRGRRDGRGRRERGEREPRAAREPRGGDESALPTNYTPIVLPGESISKYRGVEPLPVENLREVGAEAPEVETEPIAQTNLQEEVAAPEVAPAAKKRGHKKNNPDEPLSSASYSGVDGLPSLRYTPEHEEAAAEAPASEEPKAAEPMMEEPKPEETVKAEAPAEPLEAAVVEEPKAAEPVVEEPKAEEPKASESVTEAAPDEERPSARRRSWRDRVSKIFGTHAESIPGQHAEAEETEEDEAEEADEIVEAPAAAKSSASQLGNFVLEGGNVEHEELDEEEEDMPALAAHRDRYEDDEEEADEHNGSLIGATVRESGEENELEDEEYDFGGEEFEESEMVAGEPAEDEEEAGEAEGEEPAAGAAQPARARRFERRGRRDGRDSRRGAPPQRGGGRGRQRQQTRALPLISELLKEGQEILVQIAKEPINLKGARITSHIALPGRFLVYMPTVNHIGVSRKINSDEERQRLKRIVSSERENGHGGFIVRTAAANIKEEELRADIRFLKHLWTEIRTRAEGSKSPALIYHDLNLVERVLRDQVSSDFSQIWVDNEAEYERVVRFASRFQPNLVRRIKLYTKDTPLFEQFGIQDEINKSLKSKVWLKSGGSIVINQTEALVAIDINTGKYVGKTSRLEDTIVKTNIDAVKEIVRQVRLRDLGGIIVVDFIDMDERKNRQKVMQALEEAMKSDRAPSKILQFNDFGLVAITRKRVKQSLERTLGTPCPYCDATGFVKSVTTICNEVYVEMRKIRRHVEDKDVMLRVNPEVARELKSGNGRWLSEMEEIVGHSVIVKSDPQLHQEKFDISY